MIHNIIRRDCLRFFGISLDSLCFWNKAYTGGIKVHSIESEQQAHYWELGTRFMLTCVLLRQRLPVLLHFMIGLLSEDTSCHVCYQGNITVNTTQNLSAINSSKILQNSPTTMTHFKTEPLSGQPTKLDE